MLIYDDAMLGNNICVYCGEIIKTLPYVALLAYASIRGTTKTNNMKVIKCRLLLHPNCAEKLAGEAITNFQEYQKPVGAG